MDTEYGAPWAEHWFKDEFAKGTGSPSLSNADGAMKNPASVQLPRHIIVRRGSSGRAGAPKLQLSGPWLIYHKHPLRRARCRDFASPHPA